MALGRQTRTSIRIADRDLLNVMASEVRGRFTADEALAHLLRGTGAYARPLSPTAFAIERRERAARRDIVGSKVMSVPPTEIVVTGAKRDLPLNAYVGSVELIDGSIFSDADGALGTAAIVTRASALSSTHLGPGREKLFVRGIADSSFVGLAQSTVGQYWGDSRINYSAQDPHLRLYDIERVEILEGPQATLYGAGALGGLLRVIPRSADLRETTARLWAGVSAIWHGGLSRDGGGILNLPLVAERLGVRLVAYDAVDAGYVDDVSRGERDINSVRTVGWRGSLSARVSDALRLEIRSLRQVINGHDCQYVDLGADGLDQTSAFAQPFRSAFGLTDATVRADLGRLDFTSVFAVARHDVGESSLASPGSARTIQVVRCPFLRRKFARAGRAAAPSRWKCAWRDPGPTKRVGWSAWRQCEMMRALSAAGERTALWRVRSGCAPAPTNWRFSARHRFNLCEGFC